MSEDFDAVIIGAGQAATPLATALARAGQRVAVVERNHVGGTCVNEGCTPTKTMVASAAAAHEAARAAVYGVHTGAVRVDLATVRRRKRDAVESFRGGIERRLEREDGVTLIRGDARFTGPREVAVELAGGGERGLRGERVFVNTGTRPARPSLEGLDALEVLDSTSIMELDEVPEHLIVLGGGYVGLEFGQMFRRFGSRVTIVQHGSHLLPREDEDVSEALEEVLREEGLELRLGCRPVRADGGAGEVRLAFEEGGRSHTVAGSHLLLAVGRVPNTDGLGLDAAGVRTDAAGHIVADTRLRTSAAGVYALGDVKGGPAFTHVSYDDFRILRDNLLYGKDRTTDDRILAYTVFTDPQLGRVGLSEREAVAAGRRFRVARLPMSSVARAIETERTRGTLKVLVDEDDDRVLGAAMLATEGGELAAMMQLAMMGGVPYQAMRDAPFAHPTYAEALNNLFGALD